MGKGLNVTDQIRRLVDASDMSRYEIAKRTGIDQSAMSRFMSGERGLSSKALDALGELLDLQVVVRGAKRKRGKR